MATGMGSSAQALSTGKTNFSVQARRNKSRARKEASSFPDRALGGLVEGEIIPRLLLAHRRLGSSPPQPGETGITQGEASAFAPLALQLEADELLERVEIFLARGVSVETVFVELLAASARRLGEFWEEDACDFVEVTMGLWRLQEVMREIALRSPSIVRSVVTMPTALFAPMPGDQHSFGALMVEEMFARAGWQSEVLFEPERRELLSIIGDRSFDLVGLTVSCDCSSGVLAELVKAIRSVSRNPAVRVIIGGRAINASRGLAEGVGADGTAPDAHSALALAERLTMVADVPLDVV